MRNPLATGAIIAFMEGKSKIEVNEKSLRIPIYLGVSTLLLSMFVIWKVPQWQVESYPDLRGRDKFDCVNEALRHTLGKDGADVGMCRLEA
jgi:hypothetical protein